MDDPAPVIQAVSNSEIVIFAISAIILLALSAVFSASEVAFFSLSPVDKLALDEDTSRSSKSALKLLQQPKDLLATILIGNNFVNVCIAIMSTGFLEKVLPSAGSLGWLRFTVEIFGITAAILLFGEVVPKMYSTRHAKSITLLMSQPLLVLNNVPPVSWLRWLLVNGTNLVNKRAKKRGVNISSDELEQAIAMTIEDDATKDEQRILEGIVKFGNTEVRQIMCSRLDCVTISYDQSFQDVIKMILEAGYSRMPVYQETFDQIVGILYIKDLLPFLNEENFEWQNLVRKPYFIPENKKIDDLLKEFQGMKMHMAIVVDEYGGCSGLVTLEDVLEEIVGDITDEFDDEDISYTKIDDSTFLFEGKTALVDFYKILDINGKELELLKGEADTLGGFITEQAGKILMNNEFIVVDNIKLVVESSDKRRVKMVKAIIEHEQEI
jgi:gliding motility-associated protein GldE